MRPRPRSRLRRAQSGAWALYLPTSSSPGRLALPPSMLVTPHEVAVHRSTLRALLGELEVAGALEAVLGRRAELWVRLPCLHLETQPRVSGQSPDRGTPRKLLRLLPRRARRGRGALETDPRTAQAVEQVVRQYGFRRAAAG